MAPQKNDIVPSDQDLEDHGKKDIIPENEEYYTLDLKRDFDGLDSEDDTPYDIAGGNPLEDDDGTGLVVKTQKEEDSVDENNKDGVKVGEPGHWGINENTD